MIERIFQIFRAGKHTDMNGITRDYSESDLKATAEAYNRNTNRAPLVLGHPKDNAPAYGHVMALIVEGGKLFARSLVDSALVQAVREGRYMNVSASFIGPSGAANPAPGIWSLRHVGFLGAVPPAVKGMDPLNFAAEGCACFAAHCDVAAFSAMTDLYQRKTFQIFKTGPGKSPNDPTLYWSVSDLYEVADSYDPSRAVAPLLSIPLTVGDAPMGHVTSLFVDANKLWAEADVLPLLIDLVRQGRYRNIQASFWLRSRASPVPGRLYLKQVGFVDASPALVDGLAPRDFAAEAESLRSRGVADHPSWVICHAPPAINIQTTPYQVDLEHRALLACQPGRCSDVLFAGNNP